MSDLGTFYNSLFVIQITVFGVAFAGLIALSEILRPLLTSRSTQRLIKSRAFIATVILLLLGLILSAIASMLISLTRHNFIWLNLHSQQIIQNEWYAALCLGLVIATFIGLVVVLSRETRYLIPSNALEFLTKMAPLKAVDNYFETAYGRPPTPPLNLKYMRAIVGSETEEDTRSDEDINAEYENALEEYNRKKEIAAKAENPLLPLETYLMQATRRDDLAAVAASLKSIEGVIASSIESRNKNHLPDLIKYYALLLSNCIELASVHGLQSVMVETVDSSDRIASKLIETGQVAAISSLVDFWRYSADIHQGKSPNVYKRIMVTVRGCGEMIAADEDLDLDEIGDTVDDIDRSLGWLGERILAKGEPEKATLMNSEYETEFSSLLNALLGIGWSLSSKRPDYYPLIHFDSIYVIAKKLAPYAIDPDDGQDRRDTLFSLMYELKTFAENALPKNNQRGAALALIRLKDHLTIANENDLRKQAQSCLDEIMDVGALAASYGATDKIDFLGNQTIQENAINLLVDNIGSYDLSHEAYELIVKSPAGQDYKAVRSYLKKAGEALGTDFGLNLKGESE